MEAGKQIKETIIKETIYVSPTAKARPRFTVIGGRVRTYTPKKTRDAELMIRSHVLRVMEHGAFDEGVPLRLEATFYRDRPKSLPKRITMPVSRPDYDNYAKLLTDALETCVYKNDSQITTAWVKKRFGSPPRIELLIEVDSTEERSG